MIFTGAHSDWETHQRREIAGFLRRRAAVECHSERCMPLYPGSMLFNQIAIVESSRSSAPVSDISPRFDSLDVVYEALGLQDNGSVGKNTLLVDCHAWWGGAESVLSSLIKTHSERYGANADVAVHYGRYCGRIKRLCLELSMRSKVIFPRWWCAASLLALYRNSAHTVFVDTSRSLDAAMIGAECTLVAGPSYTQRKVYPALDQALACLPCCKVMSLNPDRSSSPVVGISVIENTAASLQSALATRYGIAGDHDSNTGIGPVIRTGVFWQQMWRRKVGNLSVSARRKGRKLKEDPRAFFSDSSLPGSSAVVALLPKPEPVLVPDPQTELETELETGQISAPARVNDHIERSA